MSADRTEFMYSPVHVDLIPENSKDHGHIECAEYGLIIGCLNQTNEVHMYSGVQGLKKSQSHCTYVKPLPNEYLNGVCAALGKSLHSFCTFAFWEVEILVVTVVWIREADDVSLLFSPDYCKLRLSNMHLTSSSP